MKELNLAGLHTLDSRLEGRAKAFNNRASAPSIHLRLKLATRLEHKRVDRALSRFDLADADDYAAFLDLNHSALTALRPHWRSADDADFAGLVGALTTDLVNLGAEPSTEVQPISGPIDGLGLSYVVRGSRLGSKILRKRVGSELPTAYFDFRMGTPWARLLDQIDLCGSAGPADEHLLAAGALRAFAVYASLARPMEAAA